MNDTLRSIKKDFSNLDHSNQMSTYKLYPGITLIFLTLYSEQLSSKYEELENILEINYCHTGRIGWTMGNETSIYLGSGDFSIHMMSSCIDSTIFLPNEYYEGITLMIDLNILTNNPPELLEDTEITGKFLYEKFCKNSPFVSLPGSEQTVFIFDSFYNQPSALQVSYWKLKALELLLYLAKLEVHVDSQLTQCQSEQVELVRKVHEHLLLHMDQKITIEMLSKRYLINPTTLKEVFKSVYGTSIAAHIKEHRMNYAAKMLLETSADLAEIAQAVGYKSQSKFTAAFKEYFGILPKEYRKNH